MCKTSKKPQELTFAHGQAPAGFAFGSASRLLAIRQDDLAWHAWPVQLLRGFFVRCRELRSSKGLVGTYSGTTGVGRNDSEMVGSLRS